MDDCTVKVPEDRVGEFYEMLGRWLTGEELAVGALGSPVTGLKDWTDSPEDLTLARGCGKAQPSREGHLLATDGPSRREGVGRGPG